MQKTIANFSTKLKTWRGSKVFRQVAIILLILFNILSWVFLVMQIFQAQPGPLSTYTQGRTLQLGDISVHPITVNITNKPNTHTPALCLVYVGVQIERRFADGRFYLASHSHLYPATDILPIGQDALFGTKQIRAFAFHPDDLCQRGPIQDKDLALLLIHPNGVGTISLAGLEK